MTRALRWLPVVIGIALFVVVTKLLIEDVLGFSWTGILQFAQQQRGPAAALVIVGLLLIDLALPVPSSLVMILSGALFGTWIGAALSLVGSLGGNWLGFEVARRGGRAAALTFVGAERLDGLEKLFAGRGVAAIVVSRPLPVLMETLSVAAGLSGMSRGAFLGASVAGTLPVVVIYAWAGTRSLAEASIVPAAMLLAAVVAGGWLIATASGFRRNFLSQRRPVDPEHLRRP